MQLHAVFWDYPQFLDEDYLKDFLRRNVDEQTYYYLHHRLSNDLDFFTREQVDLGRVDFTIKTLWQQNYRKIKDSQTFLSLLIQNVKV